jgi:hypothetical protein
MKTKPAKNHPWIAIPFSSTIRRNWGEREAAIRAAQERAKLFSETPKQKEHNEAK